MEAAVELQMQKYRQVLNDIHAINAEIRPLLTRTILISLNAEVASAKVGRQGQPFSVVAREMGKISGVLGNLMQDVESTIQGAIQQIARWFQTSKKMELLGQSLYLLRGEIEGSVVAMLPAKRQELPARQEQAPSSDGNPGPGAARLSAVASDDDGRGIVIQGHVQDMEREMASLLANVGARIHDLHGLLEGMNNSVGRESRYLGLFAKIEAAHIARGATNLTDTALAIQDLAAQIDGALAHAKARILA